MARIRSIHPSLFTDEAWVSCSPLARLLFIGLETDADDQGVFEWKPVQLKMRLLPADNADITKLLDELADADLVRGFNSGGKQYGAIKRFRKYQRPQKPSAVHPLPDEMRAYVFLSANDGASDDAGSATPLAPAKRRSRNDAPPDDEHSATGPVNPIQMEEGEKEGEEKEEDADASFVGSASPSPTKSLVEAIWLAAPRLGRERSSRKDVERALKAAVKRGKIAEHVQAGVAAYYATDPGEYAKGAHRVIENDRWEEFYSPPAEAAAPRGPHEMIQNRWMEDWLEFGKPGWRQHERGPYPGEEGCRVNAEIQRRHGVAPFGDPPADLLAFEPGRAVVQ